MAKKTKKKPKLTAWEESLVNPKIGPNPQPALKKLNEDQLDLLRSRIHGIVCHNIYMRVAATLWDAGVRSDTLAVGKRTWMRAMGDDGKVIGAVSEVHLCNAWGYIREWE